ncbi:MAG: DNA mismatch repair endonuclease MutL [Pirellulaceae bacterium]|nr:DNA mismatch repair endonuclease MutL [Pirellulaceae bacterium]
MPTIQTLPTSLINKIAAGEVIERPASVVKEMLENSIDAGARRIELTVEGGGTELMRISDDGCGIDKEQLLLAIAPHATSKLFDADDLFDIQTLGFRGEALASVAEISHLTLRSRTAEMEGGAELAVRGGQFESPKECAAPIGTTIEVRHLFFNTPVRLKFLKSSQTEMGHTIEAFTRIALAHPRVHMVLISNNRTLHDLPATENWSERIETFFGSEVSDQLIRIDSREGGVRLHGFAVDPSVSRSNNRMQYLFLNGRFIRDRSLQHALSEAYRGLLMVGRFPICFLHLEIPANQVDVNVHPTKSEVRFLDGGEIYRRLLQALRSKFLSTDLTAKVQNESDDFQRNAPTSIGSFGALPVAGRSTWSAHPSSPMSPPARAEPKESLMHWGHGQGHPVQLDSTGRMPEFRPFADTFQSNSFQSGDATSPSPAPWLENQDTQATTESQAEPPADDRSNSAATDAFDYRRDEASGLQASHLGFQIHNRYLVTQDDAGMVVIDQHALHERILYEQIRDRVLSRTIESQRLLIPEPITLTAAEAGAALDAREALKQIGIEIEPFGGDTILVTAYPAILANVSPAEMVRQVLEPLMEAGKQPEARVLLDSMMNMMSCKAAIKAGDKLSSDEITALLEQRHLFADTHHCPHGRPTALFFSREQLDKMFKRT